MLIQQQYLDGSGNNWMRWPASLIFHVHQAVLWRPKRKVPNFFLPASFVCFPPLLPSFVGSWMVLASRAKWQGASNLPLCTPSWAGCKGAVARHTFCAIHWVADLVPEALLMLGASRCNHGTPSMHPCVARWALCHFACVPRRRQCLGVWGRRDSRRGTDGLRGMHSASAWTGDEGSTG